MFLCGNVTYKFLFVYSIVSKCTVFYLTYYYFLSPMAPSRPWGYKVMFRLLFKQIDDLLSVSFKPIFISCPGNRTSVISRNTYLMLEA